MANTAKTKEKKIRVLMLGWEFPPYLTGGLGNACFGLSKALSQHVELHMILPKADDRIALEELTITGLNELDFSALQKKKLERLKGIKTKLSEDLKEKEQAGQERRKKRQMLQKYKTERSRLVENERKQRLKIQEELNLLENQLAKAQHEEKLAQQIWESAKRENIIHDYESFSWVDYVNVHLNPYETVWQPTIKAVQRKTSRSTKTTETRKGEKIEKKLDGVYGTLSGKREEQQLKLSELEQYYQQAKLDLQDKETIIEHELEERTLPYFSIEKRRDEIEEPLEHAVALDWANKQSLFNEENLYGEQLMDKVALYTESVLYYASELSFDIIHAHDWLTFPAAIALKKKYNKPLVTHIHSLEIDRCADVQARNPTYYVEQSTMQQADAVIAVSHFTKNNIEQQYGITANKIKVVHNGPSTLITSPSKANTKEKKILFLGRVTQQKGIVYFVETASLLLQKEKQITFYIAGMGNQLREAMTWVREKGISNKVKFLGFLPPPKVSELLSEVDILFMPSVSEPFGLVALEAAQAGIPVVLSKQTGATEVLQGVLTANYWETQHFANYLYALLRYPSLRRQVSTALTKSFKTLSWNSAATDIATLYQSLLSKMNS